MKIVYIWFLEGRWRESLFMEIEKKKRRRKKYANDSRRSITWKFPFPRSPSGSWWSVAAGSINAGAGNGNCNKHDPSAMAID